MKDELSEKTWVPLSVAAAVILAVVSVTSWATNIYAQTSKNSSDITDIIGLVKEYRTESKDFRDEIARRREANLHALDEISRRLGRIEDRLGIKPVRN